MGCSGVQPWERATLTSYAMRADRDPLAVALPEAAGRVRSFFGREPLITYAMTPRDRERMWRGIGILGELAFAAIDGGELLHAQRKAEATAQEKMSAVTSGLSLPPGMKLPF